MESHCTGTLTKTETTLFSIFLAVAFPMLTTFAFWWGSAAVSICVAAVPVGWIKAATLAGLCVGVLGDIFFLGRWVRTFHTAGWAWVAAIYLGLSFVAFAFCMGVPIGTFAVGVTGGIYLGRRLRHTPADGNAVACTLTRGALCAASLTTLLALPIGLLVLHEGIVLRAAGWLDLAAETVNGRVGQGSMVVICLGLFGLQFFSTRAAGNLAFGLRRRNDRSAAQGDAEPGGIPPAR